jgi:D-arabinose 1-dehydrogenase-like Zn-dependent alcohol dehydrogenase
MVVHEHFAIIIPETFDLKAAGPVMCAGITMYDPLVKLGAADAPKRVGIVGLGGLGVMGIKLAKALGCTVTAISRCASAARARPRTYMHVMSRHDMLGHARCARVSACGATPLLTFDRAALGGAGLRLGGAARRSSNKEKFAKSHGADTFIATSETAQLKAAAGSLDIILNTIPVYHE